eukprot:m.218961 g.218961  ORF g.218961 m.218961 type:complete len:52 (+) comp33282_c0_seq1:3741-3896(+)
MMHSFSFHSTQVVTLLLFGSLMKIREFTKPFVFSFFVGQIRWSFRKNVFDV